MNKLDSHQKMQFEIRLVPPKFLSFCLWLQRPNLPMHFKVWQLAPLPASLKVAVTAFVLQGFLQLPGHSSSILVHANPSVTFWADSGISGQSHKELSCNGAYDSQLLSRLERVCDNCYNLYKDWQVHSMCR